LEEAGLQGKTKRLVSILHGVIHELYEFREASLYIVRMYFHVLMSILQAQIPRI